MVLCSWCQKTNAALRRPKTGATICKECFYEQFELEVHQTITENKLFKAGDKVAIAASGGKGAHALARVVAFTEFLLLACSQTRRCWPKS